MTVNKILNYVLSGVVVLLGILLFQSSCNREKIDCNLETTILKKEIFEYKQTIDSLQDQNLVLSYKLDSLSTVMYKEVVEFDYTKKSLLERLKMRKVEIVKDTFIKDSIIFVKDIPDLEILSQDVYFKDSSYRVSSNIFFEGKIDKVHYMFETLKYPVNFIPRKEYATREVYITKEIPSKIPRVFLLGGVQTKNYIIPDRVNLGLSIQDNSHRIYSASVNTLNTSQITLQYQHPIIYSK